MTQLKEAGMWMVCLEVNSQEGSGWLGERPARGAPTTCAQMLSPQEGSPGTRDCAHGCGPGLQTRHPAASQQSKEPELSSRTATQPEGLLWDPEFANGSTG